MIDNHPAGWVFERGGVAFLMFVDFVSLGFFLMNIMFFGQIRASIPLFFCFSVRWPSNMDILVPEK
jgi:hypothetical protein